MKKLKFLIPVFALGWSIWTCMVIWNGFESLALHEFAQRIENIGENQEVEESGPLSLIKSLIYKKMLRFLAN